AKGEELCEELWTNPLGCAFLHDLKLRFRLVHLYAHHMIFLPKPNFAAAHPQAGLPRRHRNGGL
ncbi:MAG TPA: hypothetical protein VEQ35_05655, partial [Beijerinckia sp.]|nr:hypothetical protein [Beijerinckia sp.]